MRERTSEFGNSPLTALDFFPLSHRERVGVRGDQTYAILKNIFLPLSAIEINTRHFNLDEALGLRIEVPGNKGLIELLGK